MPIYEYECTVCGHKLEAIQKISDTPLTECPACGKPELKKLLSLSGFRLKGSGWYETDFKGSGKRPDKDQAKKKGDSGTEKKAKSKEKKAADCGGGACGH